MNGRILALLILVSPAVLVPPPALADDVPLSVTEPIGVARRGEVVTGGIPVGPLGVKSTDELSVVDAAGRPAVARISPMVAAEDGTLQWALVDVLAPQTKANGTESWRLVKAAAKPAAAPGGVTVDRTADTLTLSNGVLRVTMSTKRFDLFDDVRLDADGDGKFADDERMLAADATTALTLVRGGDKAVYTTRDGRVDAVTLEDANDLRATVRIDGAYGNAKGETDWLKWTCRVTLWAGSPDVRVLYAVRNVNPRLIQQEQIRRAAVTLKLRPLTGRKGYLLGAGSVRMSQLSADEKDALKGSQWHTKVRLEQVGPPEAVLSRTHRQFYNLKNFEDAGYRVRHFQPSGRTPVADVGFACGGWVDLAGDNGGALLWLRSFTQDTPKRLDASADGTLALDVIPEYDGSEQPYYADGGYWLGDRSYRTWEFGVSFHARPTLTDADWAAFGGSFSAYCQPTAATASEAEATVARLANRLQLVANPQWYTRTGALWGPVLSTAEEADANKALGRTHEGPVRPQPAGAAATEFLHYENFHYRSEWDEPRDAIVEYLRTGIWDFHRRAQSFARNYRDLGVWRSDGLEMDKRSAGVNPKGAGAIPRWGKFCECHNYGAGLLDMWLITGDRSYRDAGLDWGYEQARDQKAWGGFGGRNWGRKMAAVLRAWYVTRDPKLEKFLLTYSCPPPRDEALRADGRALICGREMGSWMAGLTMHAVWHTYVALGDRMGNVQRDEYEDAIVGMARQVARYWFFPQYNGGPYYIEFDSPKVLNEVFKGVVKEAAKPGNVYANGGGDAYTVSCIDMMTRGYLLTGDPAILKQAVHFWECVNGKDKTVVSARLQDFEGMGAKDFWARQLFFALAHPRGDAAPPAAVADLAAEALGGGRVKLTWTAPADVGGKVARYQVKFAPLPMVDYDRYTYPDDHGKRWTWWAGYNVPGEPDPPAAGEAQSMIVADVPAGVRYFALRSRDDSANQSAISNVVKVEVK
ncbi:MAG: hypothetical protein BIFFINMI_01293 [Phycisphaerae bacterium]|nr:hypothetical protein [Phycisphaerae bacterium]